PQSARTHLLRHRVSLAELYDELPGRDRVAILEELHLHYLSVALASLVDGEQRDHDLLKACSAVDVSRTGAGLHDSVRGLWDLHVHVSIKAELGRCEGDKRRVRLQVVADHEPTIDELALRFGV